MSGELLTPNDSGAVPAAGDLGNQQIWRRALPSMADSGEIDFRGFFAAIYRRKLLLLLMMSVVMLATWIWVSEATPEYSADVLLVIGHQSSSLVDVDDRPKEKVVDAASLKTETAVLESRTLAARVIQDYGLDQDPEFAPPSQQLRWWQEFLPEGLPAFLSFLPRKTSAQAMDRDDPALAADIADDPQDVALQPAAERQKEEFDQAALLDRFSEHLDVSPQESSHLIKVSFRSTDPAKAMRIANGLVDKYIELQLETKSEGARRTAEWLEVRLGELGQELRRLEQQVQQRRLESGSNDISMVAKTLEQLNTELVAAQAAMTEERARYDQVENVLKSKEPVEALPPIIASETVQALRRRDMELTAKLSDLRTIYGDRHPRIVSLHAELADVERLRDLEIENILHSMGNEVRRAELQEAKLRERLKALSGEMIRLNEAESSIEQLRERLAAINGLYKNLLRQHAEAVALRDNQQPDARVLSKAELPIDPTFPNVPRIMILAFVGSASLSAFVLIVAERLRQTLDTAESVEKQLGLSVIGTIPDLPRLQRLKAAPSDYIQREPLSEFGSAFQRLRALLVLGNNRKMPRSVLVTSSTAGEGKTTTAVCFAAACVTAGQRVLLIDCDFGRPRLHETVNVKNDVGLTDVMKGLVSIEDAIARAQGYSLSILTIGCSREGAIDLLNYGRMEDLLAGIKDEYDAIILDSAPVLEVSNALILGGMVDKTILVTRRDWTAHGKALEAARQLELYGADIAGVVFNRAVTSRDKYATL